jgi:hypothetical protein
MRQAEQLGITVEELRQRQQDAKSNEN